MCGIAGYYLRDNAAELPVVRRMCDEIRHRGPDDEGFFVEDNVAIGMRRLSIIDLDTGRQPISNEDGSIQIVFNGEIYNYLDLRRDLISRGHRFSTRSDTETLVHLYEQEGKAGLARLRGMFALAIWDANRRTLFLARDRFGKKPLYYAALPEGFYFASELKCLRAAGVPLELDQEALRLFFQFTYIPDPFSPFRAIRKLSPGHWIECGPRGVVGGGRYWTTAVPAAEAPAGVTKAEYCERLQDVFDESVRLRMVADVPLGAFLSGGIDSSLVVASMARQSRAPVKTFSIGFEDPGYNELQYAGAVARKYSTDHHEITVRPDSVALVSRLARHFDEPFGDSSAIPTFIVSEFAARHVKVTLSGDGGDELFGGYERFATLQRMRWLEHVPNALRGLMEAVARVLPHRAYGRNYLHMLSRGSAMSRYLECNFAPYYMRRELLLPEWMLPADAGYLRRVFSDFLLPGDADILSQALYFETNVNLPGDMLVKVDRMSMANSLEVRSPFLDHELAELAAAAPHHWKIQGGRGKCILLDAMGDRLPAEAQHRKMGFAVPLAEWFRGPLREMIWDHLTGRRFLERGLVSPAFVEGMLHEHDTRRRDNHHWLWSLLMLEMWFREFESAMNARSAAAAGEPVHHFGVRAG